jgi:Mn2+/Fe2+ NRAMP family transporter
MAPDPIMPIEPSFEGLASRPLSERLAVYARRTGPGYMQSAMTLGAGTISACVLMGSMYGYELLWVQALAILLGAAVLAAIAKQTCQTGERPYRVFRDRLHPALALLWGISALVATVIWHFPQYSLTANGISALLSGAGFEIATLEPGPRVAVQMTIGLVTLSVSAWVVRLYGAGSRGLRLYEQSVKLLVWAIVLAFTAAAVASGIQVGELARGLTGVSFAERIAAEGITSDGVRTIVGGLAAAVGINMVFLYPYSLLRKKWGPAQTELAYVDLALGMVVPFLIATTFIIVATANTVGPAGEGPGRAVRNVLELVPVLGGTFGEGLALALIGFGMIAVGISTIITHMLASGFIGGEVFGYPDDSRARWWLSFLPAVGIVGVAYPFPWAMSVTASTLAYPLMPVAVICFMVLLNRKGYMGSATPKGGARLAWNLVLSAAVFVMMGGAWFALRQNWLDLAGWVAQRP